MDKKLSYLEGIDSYLPHVDGVVTCMNNYCSISNKDCDVTAIAPYTEGFDDSSLPYNIIRCKSMHIPIVNTQYGLATKDKKFYKEVMNKKYDIVHCNSPFNMAKFMLKVAKAQHIPAVTTFHSNMRPIFRQAVKSKLLAELLVKYIGRIYNKFDEVFVCSPLVEKQCRSFGYKGRISYLPFGTSLPKCENVENLRVEANEKLDTTADELVFIYVGRIEKLKRVDFILKSLKIVKDKGIKFKFLVAGKGSAFNAMQKLKAKLGFTDEEVKFLGFIDNKLFPYLYARADLLLFPSLYDNFGLIKVEAAAYSTPGLFIKDSCAGYEVTDGINGFLSENTLEDFANKIAEAVADKAQLKEIGIKASEDLYISWEDCTKKFIERLKDIVDREKANGNKK